jgi:opacity protein-like surface antigen
MALRMIGITALSMMVVAPAMAQDDAPPVQPATPAVPAGPPMTAPAAAAPEFGAPGQIAISVDLPMVNEAPQFSVLHSSTSMGGDSSTTVGVQPSLDYFIAPDVSVGGEVGIQYSTTSPAGGGASFSTTTIDVEARVGYNIPLGDMASLWPRIGLAYAHVSSSSNGMSATGYTVPLVVFAPLLWHPAHHFFLGAGPVLTTELVDKVEGVSQGKTTSYGIQALLGGYFGGT